MLKHGAVTQFRNADAENELLQLTVKADTVRAQFTWLKQPVNCDAETTSTTMRRSCYTSRNKNTSFKLLY